MDNRDSSNQNGFSSEISKGIKSTAKEKFPAGCDNSLETLPKPVRVSIVIPVFNKAEYTEKCLYSIVSNTGEEPDYEVIVVDNGSTDWTPYLLHAVEGNLQAINNDENVGFARACNQGAAAAQGQYLVFLNNDTVVHEDWLKALVDIADSDSSIGIVGAKLLYPDSGQIQHAGIVIKDGLPEHVSRGLAADDPRVTQLRDYDMVTGACLLIRKDLFSRLGGFDIAYLNGVEDVDLCLRVREMGLRVVYCPESVLDHHEGASEGRYQHVEENIKRFAAQWAHRFDAEGRFVAQDKNVDSMLPISTVPLPLSPKDTASSNSTNLSFCGNWEGPFLVNSSLAHVNREFVKALITTGKCELGLMHFDVPQFGEQEDPENLFEIAKRLHRPLSNPDFILRHHWPPNFSKPDGSPLILMQPWEFGRIPTAWIRPLETVERVWAYTEFVKQCYVDSGINPEKIDVVPLGIEPSRFRPDVEPMTIAELKGTDCFRFLFVGGTLFRKGIDLLLEAYRQEFDAQEEVALVIKDMGVNSFYRNQTSGAQIRELQSDPNCGTIVYITDDLSERKIPGLYTACDALVHPYRGEGFGLPVAEAMACGLPSIVTQGGSTDDFCKEDLVFHLPSQRRPIHFQEDTVGQAWLLEPDMEALKAQLRYVFEHRDESRKRGSMASDYIRTHFTWERTAMNALEQIATVISKNAQSEPVWKNGVRPELSVDGYNATIDAPMTGLTSKASKVSAPSHQQKFSCAILNFGTSRSGNESLSEIGLFDRYEVALTDENCFGQQVNAVQDAAANNRDYLVVISGEAVVTGAQVNQLLSHISSSNDIGAVSAPWTRGKSAVPVALVDLDFGLFPKAGLMAFRLVALTEIGGFDGGFKTPSVFANAVRCMRRHGWRVCEATDVLRESVVASKKSEKIDTAVINMTSQFTATTEQDELKAIINLEKGDCLRQEQRLAEAVFSYERSLNTKNDFVEAILVTTDCMIEIGKAREGIDIVERLIALDPQSFQAHNYCGVVHFRAEDWDGARSFFKRAIELQPGDAEPHINLGVLEWEQENFDDAFKHFEIASSIDPSNRDLVCNVGTIYAQVGEFDLAIGILRDYLAEQTDDVEVHEQLAGILLQKGDMDGAQKVAETILTVYPHHRNAHLIIASIRGE